MVQFEVSLPEWVDKCECDKLHILYQMQELELWTVKPPLITPVTIGPGWPAYDICTASHYTKCIPAFDMS